MILRVFFGEKSRRDPGLSADVVIDGSNFRQDCWYDLNSTRAIADDRNFLALILVSLVLSEGIYWIH